MQILFADLEQQISSLGMRTVLYASLILIVTTIIAILFKDKQPKLKLPLFLIMAVTLLGSTMVLFGSTIYLNNKAESSGPVHWHSEVEFWACNAELELRNPTGLLSNKIGSVTYHEHNDKHLHLEGVVVRKSEDAGLKKFMQVTGGYLTNNSIGIPLDSNELDWYAQGEQTDGDPQNLYSVELLRNYVKQSTELPVMELKNGAKCQSGEAGELQIFVYRFNKADKTYFQEKLYQPSAYVMSQNSSLGPPSDCVIVEFDKPKDRTDKLCEQYGVRDAERCTTFGVKEFDPGLCDIREIKPAGSTL